MIPEDIVGIIDSNGNRIVNYSYDSWGRPVSMTDNSGTGAGSLNPFRYRGYFYDEETGWYYLKSRYYDPEVGRFLNADRAISGIGGELAGYNLFQYCNNNPINYYDIEGETGESVMTLWMSSMWWLTLVDGVLPVGDIVFLGVAAVIGVTTIKNNTSKTEEVEVVYSNGNNKKKKEKKDKKEVKPGEKPTEKDGYIAPKKGPQRGKTNDGKIGWKDDRGNIWVPQPTGSAGAHGGGHWDVQSPKGGYINVYPGGVVRGGIPPYPRIPIFP